MKKASFVSLAIAAALAISPAMFVGQCTTNATVTCYSFDFTSPTIDITNGLIGVSDTANPDGISYDILSFSGNYTGPDGFNGVVSLYFLDPGDPTSSANWGSATSEILAVPGWEYDNVFYPGANAPGTSGPGNSGAYFDVGGLFFNVVTTPPGGVANLWAGNIYGWPGSPGTYSVEQGMLGGSNDLGYATGIAVDGKVLPPPTPPIGSGTPPPIPFSFSLPESNSAPMLGLSILCLAGVFIFRGRRSGLIGKR
jgi:hypothetical protein